MLILTIGCDQSYDAVKQQRMRQASEAKNKQPIIIGIPWTNTPDDDYIKGVKLAVKEINQKGGILDGALLEIIINDTESAYYDTTLSQGARQDVILDIANSFANNRNVVAVIGHSSSETALLASVIYQNKGVLFLAPNAEEVVLTGHNFNYIFRTTLNNELVGTQVAEFSGQKKFKRVAVLYARTNSTEEFMAAFTTRAVEKYATDIVFRRSFFESNLDIISLAAELKSVQKLDAVCIAASRTKAAEIYQQLRNVGLKQPIIGNTDLDSTEMVNLIKQWEYSKKTQKSQIPTMYDTTILRAKQFESNFKQEYGTETTNLGALGYDAINLLAHGIQYAKSRVPLEIATTLRYMDACKGVTGKFEFKLNGDLKNKPISFYHMDKQHFIFEQVNNGDVIDSSNIEICNEVDRDHDGIPTGSDVCPDTTAAEIIKGVNLDGAERGCPIDSDNDEVPNYKDDCPDDTAIAISKTVDIKGCPVDYDKDGIPDYKDDDIDGDKVANAIDTCPKSTVEEMKFGANPKGNKAGCPVDSDGDLVLDYLDSCRTNTKNEVSIGVDAKGCPVDNDADGVLDYQDKCLKTTAKELVFGVNQAGCPVDSDSDSVPDYLDVCRANTADEISQGVDATGCPIDNDADGVLDYQDQCPKSSVDFLVDKQGCEVMYATTTLKLASLLFDPRQVKLTKAGGKYLDGLLVAHSNLQLLNKVQIIAYTAIRDIPLYNKRLQSITGYFQQKNIPLEKIETAVEDSVAKKNNAVEFIFYEVTLKSDEDKTLTDPDAVKVETPVKPEADKVKTATKPGVNAVKPGTKTNLSTPSTQPTH